MAAHQKLLEAIRTRQSKLTSFNYGISTADCFVKTLESCVGHDICNRYACVKGSDWGNLLTKASETLVYSNEDMITGEKLITSLTGWKEALGIKDEFDNLMLPKNTLMVFTHTLTTPRKDRDGDRLRSEGAKLDPKMLMLWQHIPTLPIGKMLAILEQSEKRVRNVSCLIDMNDLCHDAAVMIDNDMGRYSHGFRALAFNDLKEEYDPANGPNGYDITSFEIMEESLVSVPSNVDAETDEVVLSLVEGGKLTSDLMKARGKSIREHRPLSLNITKTIEDKHENQPGDRSGSRQDQGHKQGCTCASEKANEDAARQEAASNPQVEAEVVAPLQEDKATTCKECGGKVVDGKCEKCGYEEGKTYGEQRQVSVGEAIGIIISNADKKERAKLKRYLEALESSEASAVLGSQFRNLVAN